MPMRCIQEDLPPTWSNGLKSEGGDKCDGMQGGWVGQGPGFPTVPKQPTLSLLPLEILSLNTKKNESTISFFLIIVIRKI